MIDPDLLRRQREHFEGVAGDYSSVRLSDANYSNFKRMLWKFVLKDIRMSRAGTLSVLEAMCGLCDGLDILCENNVLISSYSAFDYSDAMVGKALSLLPSKAEKYRIPIDSMKVGSADICSFETSTKHDLVILLGGLHHVYAHTAIALQRIAASLKKGGLFINFEPTHSNPVTQAVREKVYSSNDFFDDQTESGYRLRDYNGYLLSSGFRIMKQVYPGLLLYCLFYNPDAFTSLPVLPKRIMESLFKLESSIYATPLARYLSFATVTVAKYTGQELVV